MEIPVEWLFEQEAWMEYIVRRDLLKQSEDESDVVKSRENLLKDQRIIDLINELSNWPWTVIASHKSAGQAFHKLTFLADIGLKNSDPGMTGIIANILSHRSQEGPFQLPMKIAVAYGGSGENQYAWALCDSPLIVYSLAKLGLSQDKDVRAALEYLKDLVRENGWPCTVSKELGKFRGPGRKSDPCPFASLAMLKALSAFDDLRDCEAARKGTESLLALWSESTTRHPYMFYMGNDFRKIKVPLIWYDLVHVLDVLSNYEWVVSDTRFQEMLHLLVQKSSPQGYFTPESVWTAWKDWDFGQKKAPSRWLTFIAWRIIKRAQSSTP